MNTRRLYPAALLGAFLIGAGTISAPTAAAPESSVVITQDNSVTAEKAAHALGLVQRVVTLQQTDPRVYIVAYDDDPRPQVRGEYRQTPGYADTIRLDPQANALTAVHELGHYIDSRLLGGFTYQGTTDARAVDALLALINSQAHAELLDRHSHGDDWATYAADPRETFARAFSQWVALRTADPILLQEVWQRQQTDELWAWEDFDLIAESLDKLFA